MPWKEGSLRVSRRTLVSLARVLSEVHSHTTIDTLAYELGLEQAAVGQNKLARCVALVRALEAACTQANDDRSLLELVQNTLASLNSWQRGNLGNLPGLLAALMVDGFEFRDKTLLPTTPGPATLAPQVSALEQDLESRGLVVAAAHYRQASENLVQGNFEASNGQIRSFLENLFISTCARVTERNFPDPTAALQHMRNEGLLEPSEWNTCRGLWDLSQTNGAHHGLSNSEEALFRLHFATALARYLLHRARDTGAGA